RTIPTSVYYPLSLHDALPILLVLFVPAVLTLVPATGFLWGWIPGGWRFIPALYSALLLTMAAVVLLVAPQNDPRPAQGRSLLSLARKSTRLNSSHQIISYAVF